MSTRTTVGATQTFTAANDTGLQALANMYIAKDQNGLGPGFLVVRSNAATLAFNTTGSLVGYTVARTGTRRWAQVMVSAVLNTANTNAVGVAEAVSTTGNGYAAVLTKNGTSGATQVDLTIRRYTAAGPAAGVVVLTLANQVEAAGTPLSIEYDSATGVVEVYRDPAGSPIATYTDPAPLPDGHSGLFLAGVANGAVLDDLTQGTWTTSGGDTTAPTLTGSITQGATTTSSIAITWPAGADDVAVTGYDVSSDGGTTWVASNGATATTTAHTFSGLAASTAYQIRVRAKDAAGNVSTPPLSATFTTSAPAGGATITSRPLVRNTGAAATDAWALWGPGEAFTAFVHNTSTGALLVKRTGLLTNSAAVLTFTDAAVSAAPAYRVDFQHEATGAWGMDILPAV